MIRNKRMPVKPLPDDIDKAILNLIQSDFPMEQRPFARIADMLAPEIKINEAEIIQRVKRLKKDGIIRRIGGNFSPDSLGFVSTLCAGRVDEQNIELFAETVNQFPGVTHNYIRENKYNIWFTIIAPSRKHIEDILSSIRNKTGITDLMNLPATRVFKVRAHFKLPAGDTAE